MIKPIKNKKRAQTEPSNATGKPVFRPRINNVTNQNYLNIPKEKPL